MNCAAPFASKQTAWSAATEGTPQKGHENGGKCLRTNN